MSQEPLQTFSQDNQNQFSSETIRFYKLALSQYFSLSQKNYDDGSHIVTVRQVRIAQNLRVDHLSPLYTSRRKGL